MSITYKAHNSLEAVYLASEKSLDKGDYNLCFSYKLSEVNEITLLVNNLQKLVQLKAHLRQTFHIDNGSLMATIHEILPPNINYLKISTTELDNIKDKLIKYKHELSKNSLIILTVINFYENTKFIAFFNIHHMVLDGITIDNFISDLNALLKNEILDEEKDHSYIESILREPELKNLPKNNYTENYISQLNKAKNEFNINYKQSNSDSHQTECLPNEIFKKIKLFSSKYSISIFNMLILAYGSFLCKLFNEDLSITHYPINIRKQKNLGGCFINLIAFPLKLEKEVNYLTLVKLLQSRLPFLKLISKNHTPELALSFVSIFAYSNFTQPMPLIFSDKKYTAKNYMQLANSDISTKYCQRGEELVFNCDIRNGMLDDFLSKTLLLRFFNYLEKMLDNPLTPILNTDILFTKERKYISDFNATSIRYPKNKSIDQLFKEQASKTPHEVAIIFNNETFTYAQLDIKSDQLMFTLIKEKTVTAGRFIALYFDRGVNLIVCMLAILKAGYAYIALGTGLPFERAQYILNDSDTKLLISESQYREKFSKLLMLNKNIKLTLIDSMKTNFQFKKNNLLFKKRNHHKNLSHLIYTSGTTGHPKGVMVTHKNVISLVKNTDYIKSSKKDTFALFSDVTFDASTFEIWFPLLNGAKLFIPKSESNLLSNVKDFKVELDKNGVTVLWLTKTLFDQLYQLDKTIFAGLRYLLTGGEVLNKVLISELAQSENRPLNLINGYGPTENTTFSCFYSINYEALKEIDTVPIGKPLSNRTAYIFDSHMNLLPIGAIGQLYVGGDGITLGYWRKKELTNKSFYNNPFIKTKKKSKKAKLYKTGDLARMLPDGRIEYLGRSDFQIKIRGYRVELSEVEDKLMRHPEIQQAIVLDNRFFNISSKNHYLIAYYVSESELELTGYLADSLPHYMQPSLYIHILETPKTISGKLDKKSLPNPELFLFKSKHYLLPSNYKEELVCKAFSKVLNVERISVTDNFFNIGGDSIKVIALTTALQENFDISVSDIYAMETPRNIAKKIVISKNNLMMNFDKIKSIFKENKSINNELFIDKTEKYFDMNNDIPYVLSKKPINKLLLTGATGYLGCNILYQLLEKTDFTIFIVVRDSTDENAFLRLDKKFNFYFNKSLKKYDEKRVIVLASDLSKTYLGLSQLNYQRLVKEIDTIIHAAALTKHYGEQEKFYEANVQATINLLELGILTKIRDFHHISTLSVLHSARDERFFYTEDSVIENIDSKSSIYIKTKNEAEKWVLYYRNKGVAANIYRVGNLAFMLKNFCVQENMEDNAFYNRIKCFLTLKSIANEIASEDISPVDLTAEAILKIFDKQELSNHTYHVFNPNVCNIADFLCQPNDDLVKRTSIESFLELIYQQCMLDSQSNEIISRFVLDQGWLEGEHNNYNNRVVIQDRTHLLLKHLGFRWPEITREIFLGFIKKNHTYFK